ncbi:protein-glutamate methylesterase/protein-glutamine glutaminase [Hippea maritima]|uniref:Protein-glutamate methylesterase/protein-glutamine glutaminase n=1 Tax=Hippea maritima (strain ATCC 700847 / DSM 10411 / MH2) TaxID=760142 RepID=F2LXL0_HIPMA|nr:chemotaxis response regulator protein-glutamate methylesterase [Hippea maritima]AEA33196.1 response regulator receiver modulated CheB methylesterase [Hippea maritima DSM 10411]
MESKVRVLVVDDSLISRKYLRRILEESGKIEVIDTAKDGQEAIEKIKSLKPDVVTLDIEMPRLNGLDALKIIMKDHPVPVIMVSSLTKDGAEETLQALRLGAVDYISKNDVLSFKSAAKEARQILIEKILSAKNSRIRGRRLKAKATSIIHKEKEEKPEEISQGPKKKPEKLDIRVVAIAASTGGPVALEKVFSELPLLGVPIMIVQHMPKTFTGVFANSLSKVSKIKVKEAEDGEELRSNQGYLAPGGMQMTASKSGSKYIVRVSDEPKTIYTPNANVMFKSVAETFGDKALCVIMTGMGDDGFKGLQEVARVGGTIIAQDKDSCVVWGMPRKPTQTGLADFVVPLDKIASTISKIVLGR